MAMKLVRPLHLPHVYELPKVGHLYQLATAFYDRMGPHLTFYTHQCLGTYKSRGIV